MFGRKFKFLCVGLTGCVFGGQFLGCSSDFVQLVLSFFTPAFGEALGTTVGVQVGALVDLGDLDLGGLFGPL